MNRRNRSIWLLPVRRKTLPHSSESLGQDSEIDGNARLSFHGLTGLQVRPESPSLYRFPCRNRQNRGSAEYMEVLNIPVSSDQNFQHDCALNFHLFGQKGIVRFNRA